MAFEFLLERKGQDPVEGTVLGSQMQTQFGAALFVSCGREGMRVRNIDGSSADGQLSADVTVERSDKNTAVLTGNQTGTKLTVERV